MLESPHELGKGHIDYLQSYIEEFPSFYLAHQLILKAYHNIGDPRFQRQLQITSLLSPNREELYYFINGRPEQREYESEKQSENKTDAIDYTKIIDLVNAELDAETKKEEEQITAIEREEIYQTPVFRIEDVPQITEEKKQEEKADVEKDSKTIEKGPAATDFYSWLETKNNKPKEERNSAEKEHKESTENLLDAFIQNNPSISPLDKDDIQPKKHYQIQQNIEDFSTETLARIFIKQKNYRKAIEVYEQLSLKIPEKKAYFATQILLLQDLLNEKK
jgi:hypothetical protein